MSAPPPEPPTVSPECIRLVACPEHVAEFSDDVTALWMRGSGSRIVSVLDNPPTSLVFLRDYVSKSRPCIIRNSIVSDDGAALGQTTTTAAKDNSNSGIKHSPLTFNLHDLQALIPPDFPITVDVTPDGHGDCLRRVQRKTTIADDNRCECDGICDDDDDVDEKEGQEKEEEEEAELLFIKPQERKMPFRDFCHQLQNRNRMNTIHTNPRGSITILDRVFERTDRDLANEADSNTMNNYGTGVVYYSRQNDCLREELSVLWEQGLFPSGFSWAEEAFQSSSDSVDPRPDAINLWIGAEQSVSSMHKDHYENLFYVLSGEKVFTLCPPCDAPFLYEQPVRSGAFVETNPGQWKVRVDDHFIRERYSRSISSTTRWVHADVTNSSSSSNNSSRCNQHSFPMLQYAHPITVRVQAGELLYLPALWFHRVTQTQETIAINYWYDMQFDSPLWCYFRFVQQLQSESSSGVATPRESKTVSS